MAKHFLDTGSINAIWTFFARKLNFFFLKLDLGHMISKPLSEFYSTYSVHIHGTPISPNVNILFRSKFPILGCLRQSTHICTIFKADAKYYPSSPLMPKSK